MKNEEYIKEVVSLRSNLWNFDSGFDEDVLHMVLGCATEAGEMIDMMKKHLYYGKKVDITNLKEEIGDTLWYVANLLDILHSSFEEVMEMNIRKLRKRYPEKFTARDAIKRDLGIERKTLEETEGKGAIEGLRLCREGDMWCFLLGENLQNGICGFGRTVQEALDDFHENYYK